MLLSTDLLMCIDDTYKFIFLFINPCYTILTCSSIAYVNLLVGIITLTSNVLSSGVIPSRLVGVSRLTTLLKGCLYLYRHLDLGIMAPLFNILTHVLRFVATCTLSSINFMSKIRDVFLSCTERLLQLLSRYLFRLHADSSLPDSSFPIRPARFVYPDSSFPIRPA